MKILNYDSLSNFRQSNYIRDPLLLAKENCSLSYNEFNLSGNVLYWDIDWRHFDGPA